MYKNSISGTVCLIPMKTYYLHCIEITQSMRNLENIFSIPRKVLSTNCYLNLLLIKGKKRYKMKFHYNLIKVIIYVKIVIIKKLFYTHLEGIKFFCFIEQLC